MHIKHFRLFRNIVTFIVLIFIGFYILVVFQSLPFLNKTILTIDLLEDANNDNLEEITLMYDNGNVAGYPFDGEHTVKASKGQNSKIQFYVPQSGIKKIRLNLMESSTITISSITIQNKLLNNSDIMASFQNLHNIVGRIKNESVVFEAIGSDPYMESLNFADLKSYNLNWILVLLFAGVLTKVFDWILTSKNRSSAILVFVFIILIFIPNLIFTSNSNKIDTTENRTLALFPVPSVNNIRTFPAEFDNFYNDNLPLRKGLIWIHSAIKYLAFNTSPDATVILGKDDWLFYNSKNAGDGDEISDFLGTNHYTDSQYIKLQENLLGLNNYLQSKNIELYIMYCPNKSSVYDQYMPEYYKKVNFDSKIDLAVDYLRKNTNLKLIDPKQELIENRDKFQLYFPADTHWNKLGAFVGYNQLLTSLDNNYVSQSLSQYEISTEYISYGDLISISSLQGIIRNTSYNLEEYEFSPNVQLTEDSGDELFYRYKNSDISDKKLLMFRDSYAIDMIPFLNDHFSEAVYSRDFSRIKELVEQENPNYVVIQTVERTADKLLYNLEDWGGNY